MATAEATQINPILMAAKVVTAVNTPIPDDMESDTKRIAREKSEQAAKSSADSLAALNSAVGTLTQSTATAKEGAMSAIEAKTAGGEIKSAAIDEVATADATVALLQQNAELTAQNRNIQLLQDSGGAEFQSRLMQELHSENTRMLDLSNERTAIMSRGDGGLGALISNSFAAIPNKIAQKQVAQEHQATLAAIDSTTGAQEKFASVNAKTVERINQGTIAANQTKIFEQAKIDKVNTDLATISSNAEMYNRVVSMDSQQTNNYMNELKLRNEAQAQELRARQIDLDTTKLSAELAMQPDKLELAKLELETQRLEVEMSKDLTPAKRAALQAQYEEKSTTWNRQESLRKDQVEAIARGQALLKLPVDTPEVSIDGLYSRDVSTRSKYQSLYASGKLGVLGGTPGKVDAVLRLQDPTNAGIKSKGATTMQEIRGELQLKYDTGAKGYPVPAGKPEVAAKTQMDNVNNVAKDYFARNEAAIKGPDNPLAAPPWATMQASLEGSKIPLYDVALKDLNLKDTDHQVIVDQSLAAFRAKTVTYKQLVQGITDIFTKAAVLNSTADHGFRMYGFPDQTTYKAVLQNPAISPLEGWSGSLITVDLINYTKVEAYVNKALSVSAPSNPAKPAPVGTANNPPAK